MDRIAFLTMDNMEGFFAYDHLAIEPMARRGWQVEEIPWRRPVDWNDYRMVVIRSPWDYQQDWEAFLHVLEQIDQSTASLQNSLQTVRWNIHKSYLRELEQRGVPIVPTVWADHLTPERLEQLFRQFNLPHIVVKPTVGANADDTFWVSSQDANANRDRALSTFAHRELMAQPFVDSIVSIGEYSLFYFAGEYSHAILKTPKADDFRVQEEHGGVIRAIEPDEELVQAATRVMRALNEEPLYARVDLVRLPDGTLALIELELIEPSLYLSYDPDAPERFAAAMDRFLRQRV
jgi:glutathione synthase/RimK-type ligase-like ATP-grasp enzyme